MSSEVSSGNELDIGSGIGSRKPLVLKGTNPIVGLFVLNERNAELF